MKHCSINREELQGILVQFEQALLHHQQWHDAVVRSISCKLPTTPGELAPKPYRTCRFGQWYYGKANVILRDFPGYAALGAKHKLMHKLADKLLSKTQEDGPVSVHDFDSFAQALEGMRLELYTLEHELEYMVYNHDALTGAIARMGILPAFREQHELAKRDLQACCIVMMDLDKFKDINDQYGHLAGDHVLTAAVHYMVENLRSYDKIFRYGGEEFLLLMQHTELNEACDMVERLRAGIESLSIDIEGKEPIRITASFGIALLDPDSPVENSIGRADKAMYRAKHAGRNCVQIGK